MDDVAKEAKEVTWERARDWIRDNSNVNMEELGRLQSKRDLWTFLKDGQVLLDILIYSKQQPIEGRKKRYLLTFLMKSL